MNDKKYVVLVGMSVGMFITGILTGNHDPVVAALLLVLGANVWEILA